MKRVRSLSAVVVLTLMAGCANFPQPPPDETHEVAAMLAGYERLSTLKTEEQRREFNAAQFAFERTPNDTTRLKLALAMLLPRAPWRDDARVHLLLGGVEAAAGAGQSPRRDLAQLLLKLLAERQNAQREEQHKADQLAQQLREDQRKADQLGQKLREERRKSEELLQKIESLRTIDRETRMPRKRP